MKKQIILVLTLITLFLFGALMMEASAPQDSSAAKKQGETKMVTLRLNYIDAMDAVSAVRPYGSHLGKVKAVRHNNTIIIEDVPAVVDKIVAILAVIDTRPVDLRFNVDLILCSHVPGGKGQSDEVIKNDPLMEELKTLLKYNTFNLLDSTIVKVQDKSKSTHKIREDLSLVLEPQVVLKKEGKEYGIQVYVELYQSVSKEGKQRIFRTSLSLKAKERTVVGVSKLNGNDKGLILVLSGQIVQ